MATIGIMEPAAATTSDEARACVYVKYLFGCCKIVCATREAELLVIYCSFKLDFIFDNKLLITVPEDVPCLL